MKRDKASTSFDAADGWPAGDQSGTNRAVAALVANHTLIVGQSRSGKTNAARILIEQILLRTAARVVVLDPNDDFKELRQPDTPDSSFISAWSRVAASIEIVSADSDTWGIQWGDLSLTEMAAFIGIDPKEDFGVYLHLRRHRKFDGSVATLRSFRDSRYFQAAYGEDVERYQLLLEQLDETKVWAEDRAKTLDSALQGRSRGVVVDLSSDDERVRMIMAARALEVLWHKGDACRQNHLKNPSEQWPGTVVLIDEAHLFAPRELEGLNPQKELVRQRIKRFADQGKKFNLFLMIITQQPAKLHADILAECNNRIVLRMNERRSLAVLEKMYGGLPGRYDGALTFEPSVGDALLEGDLLSDEQPPPAAPRQVQFLKACTKAGGASPPMDWAEPKASNPPIKTVRKGRGGT